MIVYIDCFHYSKLINADENFSHGFSSIPNKRSTAHTHTMFSSWMVDFISTIVNEMSEWVHKKRYNWFFQSLSAIVWAVCVCMAWKKAMGNGWLACLQTRGRLSFGNLFSRSQNVRKWMKMKWFSPFSFYHLNSIINWVSGMVITSTEARRN